MVKYLLSFLPFVIIFFGHYTTANVYAAVCAPLSLQGLLTSIVGTGSPVCNSLLSIVNYTSNTYNLILSGFIVFLAGNVSTWTRTPNPMHD